ncbi:MAG: beta-lactamase family protein, partial [Asgard group archaeon]|nr:beta-lactamase family protein [Asgard group archaeon]
MEIYGIGFGCYFMNFKNSIIEFEKKLKDLMDKYSIPGLSIAITHEHNLIYSAGLGFTDLENKIRATINTPYRIASLTKPIASTIILQLVEKGLVDLDK